MHSVVMIGERKMDGIESKFLSRIAHFGVEVLMVAVVMCASTSAQQLTVLTNVTVATLNAAWISANLNL